MTPRASLPARCCEGVVVLGQSTPPEGADHAVFKSQFGRSPEVRSGRLQVTASNAVVGQIASLWSQSRCLFWDTRRDAYVPVHSAAELDAIAPAVRAGAAWPALDDSVVYRDREGLLLFASGSGATTLYYTQRPGFLVFANRPQAISSARDAPLDRLGVGEIVRFGANYGRRTLLRGVNRIPIGHLLECSPGRPPLQRPFRDFSHRPDAKRDDAETREAISSALDRNLALIDGPRDLLFSGGVDSALLGLRGVVGGTVQNGWFYAVGDGDPEQAVARQAAAIIGLDLQIVQDRTTPDDIPRRIAAYALPTLDFSIIPTHALGSAVAAARGQTTVIDGTGGDAWFGFASLSHAHSWRLLHRFRALSPFARNIYFAALCREDRPQLRPIKGLARTPVLNSPALGHMCANPVYSALLDLRPEEWLTIEDEIFELMRSLTGGELGSSASEVIVSDACLIAVAQFAAKTSQWNLGGQASTFYPFLMPNMAALGRTMPPQLLIRNGEAKPLLKDLVAASPLGRDFAYRRKSGFQPPLQKLLQDERGGEALVVDWDAEEAPWTPASRELPRRLLRDKNSLRIGGLYAIWARLTIEFWLKSLRQ